MFRRTCCSPDDGSYFAMMIIIWLRLSGDSAPLLSDCGS